MTELIKTGIEGLDAMLNGGFPRGSTILLSGKIGTGKTVFGMQFLYCGATKYNEPGVFVTVDERPEDLRREMLNFGWNVAELEKKGKLAIIDVSSLVAELPSKEKYKVVGELSIDNVVSSIIDVVNSLGAKRLVFDSIPALAIQTNIESLRKLLYRLSNLLLSLGCASILTTEIDEASRNISKYGVEEFLVRGVIVLDLIEDARGTVTRTIKIRKMRELEHDLNRRPMHITSEGVVIYHSEKVFADESEF
ncbi:MAG: AAA family ATPase [Euryarchaeota archaeon]|nr:AAA family ATPase [Euryarchaeota archaeon]